MYVYNTYIKAIQCGLTIKHRFMWKQTLFYVGGSGGFRVEGGGGQRGHDPTPQIFLVIFSCRLLLDF